MAELAQQVTFEMMGKNGLTNIPGMITNDSMFLTKADSMQFADEGLLVSSAPLGKWANNLPSTSRFPTVVDVIGGLNIPICGADDGTIYIYDGTTWNAATGAYVKPNLFGFNSLAVLNNVAYITNGQDFLINKSTGFYTAWNPVSPAGGPPLVPYVKTLFNRLYGYGGATLYWSDLLNGDVWNSGSAGSLDMKTVFTLPNDSIQDVANYGGKLIVMGNKQTAIFDVVSNTITSGASNLTYSMSLNELLLNVGINGYKSFVNTGADLFLFNGQSWNSFARLIQNNGSLPLSKILQQYSFKRWNGGFFQGHYNPFKDVLVFATGNTTFVDPTTTPRLMEASNFASSMSDGNVIPITAAISTSWLTNQIIYDIRFLETYYDSISEGTRIFFRNTETQLSTTPQFAYYQGNASTTDFGVTPIFATNWLSLGAPENEKAIKKITLNLQLPLYRQNQPVTLNGRFMTVNIYTDKNESTIKATNTYTFVGNVIPTRIELPAGGSGKYIKVEVVTSARSVGFTSMTIDFKAEKLTNK